MKQAKDILPNLYRRGGNRRLEEWELIRAYWPEAVGRRIALHTRLASLKDGKLVVEVDDDIWRAQIEAIRGRIIESLRNELDRSDIRSIDLKPMLPARRQPGQARSAFAQPSFQPHDRAGGQ